MICNFAASGRRRGKSAGSDAALMSYKVSRVCPLPSAHVSQRERSMTCCQRRLHMHAATPLPARGGGREAEGAFF